MELKPGYKQTEVGVIPEDWELKTFSEVAFLRKQKINFQHISKPIRCIELEHIESSRGRLNGYAVITIAASLKTIFEKDDILFGKLRAYLRKYWLATFYGICSTEIWPIVTKSEQTTPKYFFQLVQTDSFINSASISYGTHMPRTDWIIVKNHVFPFPPTIAEQQVIAEALSDADALIESLEALIAKKRLVKQGAMQELLTGRTRLPGFSGEWVEKLWGDVISHCSSGATPYRGKSEFYNGSIKWITSGELNFNIIMETIEHISEEAVRSANLKVHPVGTFLMAITGLEAAGTRGACGIVGSPATSNQSCMAIYPTSELLTEYLYYYYVLYGNDLALKYCQGTKQQSYTAQLVKILPITLPPSIDEQSAIVTKLSDIDSEIAAIEEKLTKARLVKQGMMQELLMGRVRLVS